MVTSNYQSIVDQAIAATRAEIVRLEGVLSALGGGSNGKFPPPVKGKSTKVKARAGRRSKEEVDATAHEMLAFVKAAGKDGVSGRELNEKFGKVVGSTTKQFMETRTGTRVKTTGKRSGMRYFVG